MRHGVAVSQPKLGQLFHCLILECTSYSSVSNVKILFRPIAIFDQLAFTPGPPHPSSPSPLPSSCTEQEINYNRACEPTGFEPNTSGVIKSSYRFVAGGYV
ncbi:uncharacterized [Tachysurus ichikawai]